MSDAEIKIQFAAGSGISIGDAFTEHNEEPLAAGNKSQQFGGDRSRRAVSTAFPYQRQLTPIEGRPGYFLWTPARDDHGDPRWQMISNGRR